VTLFDPEPPPVPTPTVRVRMTVAYDGRGYHGFAAQAGVKTVGGTLTTSLERVLRHPVAITCAGRTDAGVHAWGQVVSFDAAADRFDPDAVQRSLNTLLAPAVVVRDVEEAPEGFDARRSARSRVYRYMVVNRPVPDPFLAATAWWVADPLDRRAMALGCDPLIGEHDFTSFCRIPKGEQVPSMVRRVIDAGWCDVGEGVLRFEIEASAFCHQMVRSLVGMLVEVGSGRRRAGELAGVLRARRRAAAGAPLAPPHGLCLWEVRY